MCGYQTTVSPIMAGEDSTVRTPTYREIGVKIGQRYLGEL